jgi:hypothetical protein
MAANARSRLSLMAVLVFLAGFTALAQPGLCPCWLIGDVRDYHPHFNGRPQRPHHHNYLFEMFPAGAAVLAEPTLLPAASLILLLGLAALWQSRRDAVIFSRPWAPLPFTPPPR